MSALLRPGSEAIEVNGWWFAHRWLFIRRGMQLSILTLFLIGPWFGIWVIKGNITSSLLLDVIPLSDPYLLIQSLFAGHWPETTLVIGAASITLFYFLIGGRAY